MIAQLKVYSELMHKYFGLSFIAVLLLILPFYLGYSQGGVGTPPVEALGIGVSQPAPIDYNVIAIQYFPPDSTNRTNIDSEETGVWPSTMAFWKAAVAKMLQSDLKLNTESTKYHGYSNPGATPYLNFKLVGQWSYDEKFPRGHVLNAESSTYRPDYNKVLSRVDICNLVDNLNVKEVWVYGYHSKYIVPDESRMSSKYGDVSNAWPREPYVAPQFRLPICSKAYVLYNFTYNAEGGNGNDMHDRLHQIENVVFYAENKGYPANNFNTIGSMFWDDFSIYRFKTGQLDIKTSCGNTHSPPNTMGGYIYWDKNVVASNCETWDPDDSKTTYINLSCDRWGCTPDGFYKWYMQSLPGRDNGITNKEGCRMRNWWDLFLDFNAFIEKGRSLWDCSLPVIAPSPTSVPISVPTEAPEPLSPIMVWPRNGQEIDLEGPYRFVAESRYGALRYEWKIEQGGQVLYSVVQNALGGNAIRLDQNAPEHASFKVGTITTSVRIVYPYGRSDWTSINNTLRSRYADIKTYTLTTNIGVGSGQIKVKKYNFDSEYVQMLFYQGWLDGLKFPDRYQIYICSSTLQKCVTSGVLKALVGQDGVATFRAVSFRITQGYEYNEIKVWSVGINSRCPYVNYFSPSCLSGE